MSSSRLTPSKRDRRRGQTKRPPARRQAPSRYEQIGRAISAHQDRAYEHAQVETDERPGRPNSRSWKRTGCGGSAPAALEDKFRRCEPPETQQARRWAGRVGTTPARRRGRLDRVNRPNTQRLVQDPAAQREARPNEERRDSGVRPKWLGFAAAMISRGALREQSGRRQWRWRRARQRCGRLAGESIDAPSGDGGSGHGRPTAAERRQ